MANPVTTIHSLRAVDAWIDVINANINGSVRTAYKASRLKFAGSNADVIKTGTSTSLPLQVPEPSLVSANTVIDFTQGAITSSTESSHLAIQGTGFFLLLSPETLDTTVGATFGATLPATGATRFLLTRDGEFHTAANGLLVNSAGYYVVLYSRSGASPNRAPHHGSGGFNGLSSGVRAVYNDLDQTAVPTTGACVRLSDFIRNAATDTGPTFTSIGGTNISNATSLIDVDGRQQLKYSTQGATVFDVDCVPNTAGGLNTWNSQLFCRSVTSGQAAIQSKSLEASNASMTQNVPELSLAQKLFSALTKILQTSQTNLDNVLNLVR